ncbi:MAG: zinc ribbon domain-containing protein [Acidobacteria bacterium]|nr:zinc ribbon domain-containing protein [Acidobacteriota bacterium]
MLCPRCESDNPSGKRFCGDCGAPLINSCPKCGVENPPGKRFCGDCGTSLAASSATARSPASSSGTLDIAISVDPTPPADGERKTVTALLLLRLLAVGAGDSRLRFAALPAASLPRENDVSRAQAARTDDLPSRLFAPLQ